MWLDRVLDPVTEERLRRVNGKSAKPQSVARRVFVGGMPFGFEVRPFWSHRKLYLPLIDEARREGERDREC
jgi:hypothetical protein